MASDLETSMRLSFATESASAARNRLYVTKVKREGRNQQARLLAALARGEEISARRALTYLRGKISALEDHLSALRKEKEILAGEVYPQARAIARQTGDKSAEAALDQFEQVNANHVAQLTALAADETGRPYFVCQVCGYVAAEEVPERCPVCGAVPERFKEESI